MRAKFTNVREGLTVSLWVVPALLVAAAVGLAALLLFVDGRAPALGGGRPWLFGGTAGAARTLLAAIAGSLITVVATAFSVTLVAIQQASAQFSPRVIRNFMRDRGSQVVLGAYIATFAYALLVLRQVREPSEGAGAFIPALAITGAMALALRCVGLLIYFIHHIAVALQVATITESPRPPTSRCCSASTWRICSSPWRSARRCSSPCSASSCGCRSSAVPGGWP